MDLFDYSRRNDPATSHEAAAEVMAKMPRARRCMYEAFAKPRTANEAAAMCVIVHGGQHDTYRKRKHELYRLNLIRFVETRRCKVTGKQAEVFQR